MRCCWSLRTFSLTFHDLSAAEMIWFLTEGRRPLDSPCQSSAFGSPVDVGSSEVQRAALYSLVLLMAEKDFQEVTWFSTTDNDISAFLGTDAYERQDQCSLLRAWGGWVCLPCRNSCPGMEPEERESRCY